MIPRSGVNRARGPEENRRNFACSGHFRIDFFSALCLYWWRRLPCKFLAALIQLRFVRCEFSSRPRLEPIPPNHRFHAEAVSIATPAVSLSATSFRRSLSSTTRLLLSSLSTVLAPDFCRLCNQPLLRLSAAPVCDACWAAIRSASSACAACSCCGAALLSVDPLPPPHANSDAPDDLLCSACHAAPTPFARVVTHATYSSELRLAIHALKYTRIHSISQPLGRMLADAIRTLAPETPQSMLVISVPLHPRRQRNRGFNQARLLAASALRDLRRTHPDWRLQLSPASLVRQRQTSPQASLTLDERRLNLDQAFHVSRPQDVAGRTVLLIDDIVTTGATARACAQSLLDAGASTVYVAALARAQISCLKGQTRLGDEQDIPFAFGEEPPSSEPSFATASPHPT